MNFWDLLNPGLNAFLLAFLCWIFRSLQVLVGMKRDMKEKRVVTRREGEELAARLGIKRHCELDVFHDDEQISELVHWLGHEYVRMSDPRLIG